MKGAGQVVLLLLMLATAVSCGEDKTKDKPKDTMISGTIDIAADETYRPIIEQELKVFDSSYPEAHINVTYKSENECIKDFMNGDVKMVLVTRELSKEEKQVAAEHKMVTTSLPIAKDAVAIVVNNDNPDTVFSIDELQGIMTGVYEKKKYSVVFDNQGSSTLRYMMDSLIPGRKLSENVYAAKGNDSVIQYVAEHPNALGVLSVNYVSDFNDPEGIAFIKTVKVAAVYNDSLEKAYKPYQAYIAPDWYPLTRQLYYIHSQTYPGLATGFAKFLREQRGQLIFKQARLFPTRVNIIFRQAEVNQ